jgi:hypothetical protein
MGGETLRSREGEASGVPPYGALLLSAGLRVVAVYPAGEWRRFIHDDAKFTDTGPTRRAPS